MKIAFATCVQLGLSCIEEVHNIGGEFDLFITLKDSLSKKKSGRVYLDEIAEDNDVPLLKINHINDDIVIDTLKEYNIDWLFIIGWSQIANKEVLNAPKKGCIGMHPTLLPEGRGRAAIPWAILKGLPKTGVTMFKLDDGVDTGSVIAQETIELSNDITATTLYKLVNQAHTKLISDNWQDIVNDNMVLVPQDHSKATIWPGRKPEDGEITSEMTMSQADALVRAVTHPYPGSFYINKETNKTYRVWSATISEKNGEIKLKDGYLKLLDYEIEGE